MDNHPADSARLIPESSVSAAPRRLPNSGCRPLWSVRRELLVDDGTSALNLLYRSRCLNLADAGGHRAARPVARPRLPGLRVDAGPRDGGVGLRAQAALNPPPGGDVYWFMETSVKAPGRHQRVKASGWLQLGLRVAGAVLLAVSAGIHLDLYLTGYRSIPTIGWLFLLQVIAGFVLAAAVVVMRSPLVAAAGAGFALATLGGYLLSVWIGLFGFKEVRTTAGIAAGLIEVAAFAVLALAAITAGPVRQAGEPASLAARMLARVQAAAPLLAAAVGAVSVAALALLGVAVASAAGQPAAPAGASVTLKTATIGGVTVLTNAHGLTLYWFAPDTPATSTTPAVRPAVVRTSLNPKSPVHTERR
jgi:hypothetical protein